MLRTHDFGDVGGIPYISMEYLEGVTLKDLIRQKGALPVPVGLRVAKQMCLGLEAAHAQGVVHRDIKPENLFLTVGIDGAPLVKVLDFGISKQLATDVGLSLTNPASSMYLPLTRSERRPESGEASMMPSEVGIMVRPA